MFCVVYSFYKRTLNREYGPLGQKPILPIVDQMIKGCKPILQLGEEVIDIQELNDSEMPIYNAIPLFKT